MTMAMTMIVNMLLLLNRMTMVRMVMVMLVLLRMVI